MIPQGLFVFDLYSLCDSFISSRYIDDDDDIYMCARACKYMYVRCVYNLYAYL